MCVCAHKTSRGCAVGGRGELGRGLQRRPRLAWPLPPHGLVALDQGFCLVQIPQGQQGTRSPQPLVSDTRPARPPWLIPACELEGAVLSGHRAAEAAVGAHAQHGSFDFLHSGAKTLPFVIKAACVAQHGALS